jgi:predicted enzyme related to lactoylglutathione lyase
MAHIEKHPVGAFCWVELATSDQKAAKDFYCSLFGWSVNDLPMGPQDVYSIFQLEGRDAAAACTLQPDERTQGVPPHWNLYIAVESADQTAARAAGLGGKVLAPAFDVMTAGRMAVLQDPTGAIFMAWEPKSNAGIGIAGVDGTLCWADLSTPDPERAARFYTGLFDWTTMEGENDDYLHIKNGEDFIGGIPPAAHRKPGVPPHWLAYFYASDVEGTAAKAKQLGATLYMPPRAIENVGTISIIGDPQGAVFAIFKSARQ